MDQAVDEERFGGALGPALGIGFGSDGSELGFFLIGAGDDILGGQAVGDGVLGDGGLTFWCTRTRTVLGILSIGVSFVVGSHQEFLLTRK